MIGIVVGMALFHALGTKAQLVIQLPVAVLISVLLYLVWVFLLRMLPLSKLTLGNASEHVLAGSFSLLWNPVIFIPLHYFTQGYLTAAGNIAALALFQIPVNAIAVLVAWKAGPLKPADPPSRN